MSVRVHVCLHTILWHNVLKADKHHKSDANLPCDLFISLAFGFFGLSKLEQLVTE